MNNERIIPKDTKIRRQDKISNLLSTESVIASKLHNLLMEYVENSEGVDDAYLLVARRGLHNDIDKLFDTLKMQERNKLAE